MATFLCGDALETVASMYARRLSGCVGERSRRGDAHGFRNELIHSYL